MTDNTQPEQAGITRNPSRSNIELNRAVAYKGEAGQRREEYCREQLRYMKACHTRINTDQAEYVKNLGLSISCSAGCSRCCQYLYIGATLQECEAVVYHLYSHEDLFEKFIQEYPVWRENIRQSGDLFEHCQQEYINLLIKGESRQREQAFEEAVRAHNKLGIPCPFLNDNLCSIYDVRPSNCAGFFVTTPPSECEPLDLDDLNFNLKFNLTSIEDATNDVTFYFNQLAHPVTLYMPVAAYRIIEEGFSYLSRFAGLEKLRQAATNDPEVRAVIRMHHNR